MPIPKHLQFMRPKYITYKDSASIVKKNQPDNNVNTCTVHNGTGIAMIPVHTYQV